MKKILIVVDMQNDFVNGSLGSERARSITANVQKKIARYRANDYLVIFTRDTHDKNYLNTREGKNLPVEHCVYGTPGWEVIDGLDSTAERFYVDKNNFAWDGWKTTLNGYANAETEFELVGLCTDVCVVSNAIVLRCLYPENTITVDSSCCAGVTDEGHEAALLTLRMCHVNVV